MRAEELTKLYKMTPEQHERVKDALRQLDEAAPARCRKRKITRQIVVAFAILLLLAVFSSAAYATRLFGLLTEEVGEYGIDMRIVEETISASKASKRYVVPNPTYLPEGCREPIGEDEAFHPVLGAEGVTTYNPNGNYQYTDGNGVWVHFHVYEADKFREEARYIVDSFEKEFDGHKTVFLTRQLEDNGEQDHYAVKYFEDWGYVVDCYYNDIPELMKIMEGLELREPEEAVDHAESPTIDMGDDPYAGFAVSMAEEKREYRLGETFTWTDQIVSAPSPLYCYKGGEYEITVTSVKEHDGVKGLDRSKLLAPNDEEWFARYFNADGSLRTPYIRTERTNGDGVDSLGHVEQRETARRFYLVTVKVKALEGRGGFTGQFLSSVGGAIYQEAHQENGTEVFTVGIVADEDVLSETALEIPSRETVIDDVSQTVICKEIQSVIPLFDNR